MKSVDESVAAKQLKERACTALLSRHLLLRYALANDLVSWHSEHPSGPRFLCFLRKVTCAMRFPTFGEKFLAHPCFMI